MTGSGDSRHARDELRSRYLYDYLHQPPTDEPDPQLFRTILLEYANGQPIDEPVQLGQVIHHPHPTTDILTQRGAQLAVTRTFTPGVIETYLAKLNPDETALGYHTHTPYGIPPSTSCRGFKDVMYQALRQRTFTGRDAHGMPDELRATSLTRHVPEDDDLICTVSDSTKKRGQPQTNIIFDPEGLGNLVQIYASGYEHYEYAYEITGPITIAFRGLLRVTSTQVLQALNPSIDCHISDDKPLHMTLFTKRPTTANQQISKAPLEPPYDHIITGTAEGRLVTGLSLLRNMAYELVASQVEWTDITTDFLQDNEPSIIRAMGPPHPRASEVRKAAAAALRQPAALPPPIEGIPEITRQILRATLT